VSDEVKQTRNKWSPADKATLVILYTGEGRHSVKHIAETLGREPKHVQAQIGNLKLKRGQKNG
jgi:transposase-like protein